MEKLLKKFAKKLLGNLITTPLKKFQKQRLDEFLNELVAEFLAEIVKISRAIYSSAIQVGRRVVVEF